MSPDSITIGLCHAAAATAAADETASLTVAVRLQQRHVPSVTAQRRCFCSALTPACRGGTLGWGRPVSAHLHLAPA